MVLFLKGKGSVKCSYEVNTREYWNTGKYIFTINTVVDMTSYILLSRKYF